MTPKILKMGKYFASFTKPIPYLVKFLIITKNRSLIFEGHSELKNGGKSSACKTNFGRIFNRIYFHFHLGLCGINANFATAQCAKTQG